MLWNYAEPHARICFVFRVLLSAYGQPHDVYDQTHGTYDQTHAARADVMYDKLLTLL